MPNISRQSPWSPTDSIRPWIGRTSSSHAMIATTRNFSLLAKCMVPRVARRIASAIGDTIVAERAPGWGSQFVVRLAGTSA